MEKIPTYLEYKIMELNELEKTKYDLVTKLRYAEEKWAIIREDEGGTGEYKAWLDIRFWAAKLRSIESIIRTGSFFSDDRKKKEI